MPIFEKVEKREVKREDGNPSDKNYKEANQKEDTKVVKEKPKTVKMKIVSNR